MYVEYPLPALPQQQHRQIRHDAWETDRTRGLVLFETLGESSDDKKNHELWGGASLAVRWGSGVIRG